MEADGANAVSLQQIHQSKLCAANTCRILQHTLEHRLEIAGGPTDHAKYFGRCRLLLQRFGKFAGPCLHFVEQPNILDSDHCLVGEGRDQLDLFCAVRFRFLLRNEDYTDDLSVAQQWGAQCGAIASDLLRRAPLVFPVGQYIRDVHDAALGCAPADDAAAIDMHIARQKKIPDAFMLGGAVTEARREVQQVAFALKKPGIVSLAKVCCRFDKGVENRLQIEG